ncbi:nitrogen regulation protein NR(II) [Oceanisphaera avium]|uniref:Sensory histidine kinase/phosphatase NtrB n=1 Tax=Oceanisphaera avium TaxID=1903694 RepID=A0A1Y0CYK5_9GAMM|nr:nitrogen regulation protein NR(II) [Oceanisphaera avium]ART80411.1 two-component system sensor histidine kinase NtrB [Oceanisphaera avium]
MQKTSKSTPTLANLLASSALLDNLLTGVLVVDSALKIHLANAAARQFFALTPRRLQQANLALVDKDLALDISLDLARIRQAITQEHSFSDSEVLLVSKGQRHWVQVSVTPLGTEQGLALIEVHLVDQQKKISQELQQRTQQQAARELVRALAHEIKNPLAGLRGAAQLLERALVQEELKEFTQLIIGQADRLSKLVDRLLGPQQVRTYQAENVHCVLERVSGLMQLAISPEIELSRDYDPSIPELIMDAEQLEQAFLNVVQNAAQALMGEQSLDCRVNKKKKITLKTRIAHHVLLQGQLHRLVAEIRIIDNGPGVPLELRDTLFYPLVSGRPQGTGLGLSLAQDIIQQHQGQIALQSSVGHTEFIIYLPLKHSLSPEN